MPKRYEVIVIGVGAMGASTCYQLASRGLSVLGLDRFDIPNTLGTSHGQSRAIRMCYFEHPDYVPLLRRSYELWRSLEKENGQQILHVTGGIWFGPAECELIAGSLSAAKEHGLDHQWLNHDEAIKRYPQFTVPEEFVGFYEPQAGVLLPEAIITAYARLAKQLSATLLANVPVQSWEADSSGVVVQTTNGFYEADKLVICSGVWSEKLIKDLGVDLPVTRQIALWVQPEREELFAIGAMPIWAINREAGGMYYGFPVLDDKPGFKLAVHNPGELTNPDKIDRVAHPQETEELREMLSRYIPQANGEVLEASVCMYSNTPDAHFVIDHHPHYENVFIACGFSGHGFKFASVVGEALADLATTGRTDLPIGFLGLGRFVN
ncbi:MAG: N-methyl-L-tryptophan oxidase [Planctomycetes bacterium]|nr:N-methyl-L-tryptophan oxidase [Planctomycetota bacterium]